MATVYLTLAAEIDIDRLSDYLQDYAGDEAAKNFADLIEKGMSILSETPLLAGYSGLSNEYTTSYLFVRIKNGTIVYCTSMTQLQIPLKSWPSKTHVKKALQGLTRTKGVCF